VRGNCRSQSCRSANCDERAPSMSAPATTGRHQYGCEPTDCIANRSGASDAIVGLGRDLRRILALGAHVACPLAITKTAPGARHDGYHHDAPDSPRSHRVPYKPMVASDPIHRNQADLGRALLRPVGAVPGVQSFLRSGPSASSFWAAAGPRWPILARLHLDDPDWSRGKSQRPPAGLCDRHQCVTSDD
jgi:hypothetical protein